MSYRLPPLSALRAFESAARHLSFKKAAEELHVTPAAISQQIKTLESYLGTPLFHRLTRALSITAQGSAMLPKVREGFDCLAAAVDSTRQTEARVLTIMAPPSFATHWLLPRLPKFSAAHPDIEIHLSSGSDSVDRQGQTVLQDEGKADPREADSWLSIRYGTGNYPDQLVERILAPTWIPVCSPELPSPERPLKVPEDLGRHVLIHDQTMDGSQQPGWSEWLTLAGVKQIDASRGPHFSNAALALEAARAGQGVALALQPLVAADLSSGRLITPFAFTVASPYAYFLVMKKAVAGRASVTAFRTWLLAEILS